MLFVKCGVHLLSKVVGDPDVAEELADLADERRQRQQTLAAQGGWQQGNDGHREGHRLLRGHDHRRDRLPWWEPE